MLETGCRSMKSVEQDENHNAITGDVVLEDVRNCFIHSDQQANRRPWGREPDNRRDQGRSAGLRL